MDHESEVILEQMEGTRASLEQKLETLENQVMGTIQEATATVSETVQQVKDAVTDTVETVKGTVEGTVETVRDTVQDTVDSMKETLDVRRQVKNHPWLMFGGSCAVGFVVGRMMRPSRPRSGYDVPFAERVRAMSPSSSYEGMRPDVAGDGYDRAEERAPQRAPEPEKPGLLDSLASAIRPELGKLKGLALGATLGIVRDLITQSVPPEVGSSLADMVNDFTSRLGGEVIPGPILQSFMGERASHSCERGPANQETAATSQHAPWTGTNH